MIQVTALKKGIRLEVDPGELDGLSVRGDAQAFRQILTNLVGNAVKFSDEGVVRVHAAMALECHGRVRLTVNVN